MKRAMVDSYSADFNDVQALENYSNTYDNKIKEKNDQLLLERTKLCGILTLIMVKKCQEFSSKNKKLKDIYSSITSKEDKIILSKYSCEIPY